MLFPTSSGYIFAMDTAIPQDCEKLGLPYSQSDRDTIISAIKLVQSLTVGYGIWMLDSLRLSDCVNWNQRRIS